MAFVPHLPLPRARAAAARPAVSARRRVAPAAAAYPTPLHDRVLVKTDDAADKVSSILLSASAKQKQSIGTVVAVARGRYSTEGALEEIPFQIGDRVVWKNDYGAEKVNLGTEDEPLLALRVYSIIGTL